MPMRAPLGHDFDLRYVKARVELLMQVGKVLFAAIEDASEKALEHNFPLVNTIAPVDARTQRWEGGLLVQRRRASPFPHLFVLTSARDDPDGVTHIERDADAASTKVSDGDKQRKKKLSRKAPIP